MRYRNSMVWLTLGLAAACRGGSIERRSEPLPNREFWVGPHSACADSSARWLPPTRVSDTLSVPDPRRRDQQWAWWARRVPGGWAGGPYYLSSVPGPPTILLREPARKADALAALDTRLPPAARRSPFWPDTIIARQARWDLAELYDWLQFIESNFGTAQGTGINMWGITNQKNALTIGIENAATLPEVTRWLRGLGIPCRLVVVEVIGRISAGPAWVELRAPIRRH